MLKFFLHRVTDSKSYKFYTCIKLFALGVSSFQCSGDYKCDISTSVWTEARPEASWRSTIELFANIVNGCKDFYSH